jgi:hypothetical protein
MIYWLKLYPYYRFQSTCFRGVLWFFRSDYLANALETVKDLGNWIILKPGYPTIHYKQQGS